MTRNSDIVADIKAEIRPSDFDLGRAEGRADFDDALRDALWAMAPNDEPLRRHAGAMLAQWRRDLFDKPMGQA